MNLSWESITECWRTKRLNNLFVFLKGEKMKIERKNLELKVNERKITYESAKMAGATTIFDVIVFLFEEELEKRNITEKFELDTNAEFIDVENQRELVDYLVINDYHFQNHKIFDILNMSKYTKKEKVIEKTEVARKRVNLIIDEVLELEYEIEV